MAKLKPSFKKAILLVVLCTLCLGAAIIGGFVLYVAYNTHSTSVDFQEYTPKTLPGNVTITGRTLEVWSNKTSLFTFTKLLTFNLSASHSSFISEAKNSGFHYSCDGQAINQQCVVAETPTRQRYLLTTTYSDTPSGMPFSQEVTWVRGGTRIWITLDGSPVHTYSQDEWSRVIDSFAPVHYSKITIKQFSPGP